VAADGTYRFNEERIDAERMNRYLELMKTMNPRPAIMLYPLRGADCEALLDTALLVEKRLPCEPGLCFLLSDMPAGGAGDSY